MPAYNTKTCISSYKLASSRETHKIVAKDRAHEPTAIDQSRRLEQVVVLLALARLVRRRRVGPDPTLVDIEQSFHDVVVVPAVDDQERGGGRWHAQETVVREGVGVDPARAIM